MNSTNELMLEIAQALKTGDELTLDRVSMTIDDLLMNDEERNAWNKLIEAAQEAIA